MKTKKYSYNSKYCDDTIISETSMKRNFNQQIHIVSVLTVFTLTFFIYYLTLSPSIAGGDSGELVAEGCTLGTSHPPGYPLFTVMVYGMVHIVGKAFKQRSAAYLVNCMDAILGSAASAIISSSVFIMLTKYDDLTKPMIKIKLLRREGILRGLVSVCTGLMYAFSPLTWQYSITAEVFALNNFFASLLVFLTIQVFIKKDIYWFYYGSFVSGLALTNQHTIILLEIPLILGILTIYGGVILNSRGLFLKLTLFFVLGLLPYLFLPLFATLWHHRGSWGNVKTLRGFIHHLLRMDYGTFRLYSGGAGGKTSGMTRTVRWAKDFICEQSGGNILIIMSCIVGIYSLLFISSSCSIVVCDRHYRVLSRTLVLSLCFYLFVFHGLANLPLDDPLLFGVHQRFWMQPNILAFIVSGYGMYHCIRKVENYHSGHMFHLVVGIMLSGMIYNFYHAYEQCDQSKNDFFYNYARGILENLPEKAVLFINYDQQWTSIRYLQECEGFREDITSISLSMMSYSWWKTKKSFYDGIIKFPGDYYSQHDGIDGGFSFGKLMDKNYRKLGGKLFRGGHLNFPDRMYAEKYEEIPLGMVKQIIRKRDLNKKINSLEKYYNQSRDVWENLLVVHNKLPDVDKKYGRETWEWTIHREFFTHWLDRTSYLLDLGVSEMNDEHHHDHHHPTNTLALMEAASWYEYALEKDSLSRANASILKNLGLAYMNLIRTEFSRKVPQSLQIALPDSAYDASISIVQLQDWISKRWLEVWGSFLKMDKAREDPSYEQVRHIYDTVTRSLSSATHK